MNEGSPSVQRGHGLMVPENSCAPGCSGADRKSKRDAHIPRIWRFSETKQPRADTIPLVRLHSTAGTFLPKVGDAS